MLGENVIGGMMLHRDILSLCVIGLFECHVSVDERRSPRFLDDEVRSM